MVLGAELDRKALRRTGVAAGDQGVLSQLPAKGIIIKGVGHALTSVDLHVVDHVPVEVVDRRIHGGRLRCQAAALRTQVSFQQH